MASDAVVLDKRFDLLFKSLLGIGTEACFIQVASVSFRLAG
jgi:hypothetical protein